MYKRNQGMNVVLKKIKLLLLVGLYGISLHAQVPVRHSGNQEKELQVYYSKSSAYMMFGISGVLASMGLVSYVMRCNDQSAPVQCGFAAALFSVVGAVLWGSLYYKDTTKPFLIIDQYGIITENEGRMIWGDIIEIFADSKVVNDFTTKDVLHITLCDGSVVDINLMWADKSSKDCLTFMRKLQQKMMQ